MRQAIVLADLGYGDVGKGSITDYLTRKYHAATVVRYNGGAQAAHNVVMPDGRQHTFAQFGSGTLAGARTYLSRYMLVNPLSMLNEAAHLRELGVADPLHTVMIDHRALITTPYHVLANRLREQARGDKRHGSCGMGIGETQADYLMYGDLMLQAGDLSDIATTRRKLDFIYGMKRAQLINEGIHGFVFTWTAYDLAALYCDFANEVYITNNGNFNELLDDDGTIIFEGAQGVLLDEDYGFHPYTTWSHTTFANADKLLEGYTGKVTKLGLMRTYSTRHGAGPFVTEDASLKLPELHNGNNAWQREFRLGYLDLIATRYALDVLVKVDGLVVSHLDYLDRLPEWKLCTAYKNWGNDHSTLIKLGAVWRMPDLEFQAKLTRQLFACKPSYWTLERVSHYLPSIEQYLEVPILITSSGPTADDKAILRRMPHEEAEPASAR